MLESLLNELRASGHLRGEALLPPPAESGVSIWILALQVIGGWLAAIFMLLFLGVGAAPLIRGAASWVVVGLVTTALTGLWMRRIADSGGGTVLRQFLLVASLAGHGALVVGASEFGKVESSAFFFMIAAYEIVLLLWVAWMPHRLVAALVGAGALVAAVDMAFSQQIARYWFGVYWFAVCLLWHQEKRWQAQRYGEAVKALACALTVLSFAYAVTGFFADDLFGGHESSRVDAVLISAVSIAFVLVLARPLRQTVRNLAAVVLLLAALGLAWQAPAVGMGSLALVFGFARGHRWLMWAGGTLLVFGVGHFYYDLQLSLLDKSGLMVVGGVLLLAVRGLIGGREDSA